MSPVARMGLMGEFANALHRTTGDFPEGAEDSFERLARRYEAPERAYHNLEHVEATLYWSERVGQSLRPKERAILSLAVFYHDAVYDSQAKDNEERSVELARHELGRLGVRDRELEETERLILLTKNHTPDQLDRTGAALVDADLAVLASLPEVYERYAAAIREEYAWVPDEDYRIGRTKVLEGLMARKLFCSALLDEEAARTNMRREIVGLRAAR